MNVPDATAEAQRLYSIWRGASRGPIPDGPHWDFLSASMQDAFRSVVQQMLSAAPASPGSGSEAGETREKLNSELLDAIHEALDHLALAADTGVYERLKAAAKVGLHIPPAAGRE